METRFDMSRSDLTMAFIRKFNAAAQVVTQSPLSPTIQELVKIRASQINGCAFCVDMHTKDALAAGEDPQRLSLVSAWRDATVFTEEERAALGLAEEGTRIADGATGVGDEVWQAARKHFDDDQLAALIMAIAVINTYNRLNVISGRPGGDYEVGQFAH